MLTMSDQKFPFTFLYMPLQMQGKQLYVLCSEPYYTDSFFLDAPNVDGKMHIRGLYQYGKRLSVIRMCNIVVYL